MPIYGAMMLRILDEHGVKYGDDILKIITPLGYVGTAKYYREQMGLRKSEEELIALMHKYAVEEYTYNVPAKKNVIEVLKKLKARGDSLNVLTASPHPALDPCLKRLGIYGLFDNVWSCEDFNTTKSDPEIYKIAAEKMGVPVEEVIFLDDNYNADKTAKSAGMIVYGVYDLSSKEYAEEIKSVTDRYINDFIELL
jgi:HAD superfamily hydrolase (TIGR01509 family)